MLEKAQRELEAQPFATVAVIRDTHGIPFPRLLIGLPILGKNSQKTTSHNLVKNHQMRGTLCNRTPLGWHSRKGREGRLMLHRKIEEGMAGEFVSLAVSWLRSEAFESLVELNEQCLELLAEQALVRT